jgi:hypothetical protein
MGLGETSKSWILHLVFFDFLDGGWPLGVVCGSTFFHVFETTPKGNPAQTHPQKINLGSKIAVFSAGDWVTGGWGLGLEGWRLEAGSWGGAYEAGGRRPLGLKRIAWGRRPLGLKRKKCQKGTVLFFCIDPVAISELRPGST